MLRILLNRPEIDSWAGETIRPLLSSVKRVGLLVPPEEESYGDGEALLAAGYTSRQVARRVRSMFQKLGVPSRSIAILEAGEDDLFDLSARFDLLFLYGGDVLSARDWLRDTGLMERASSFEGILITAGAVSEVLGESFGLFFNDGSFQEEEGLGLLGGVDTDMSYYEDIGHIQRLIRLLESRGRQILVCPADGGVLLSEEEISLLGSAFIADEGDLDELYSIYESLR